MNIFVLSESPAYAAQMQCDKHVVKMILESAQMLSTAHRMLDGVVELRPSKSGKRTVKHYILPDSREDVTYKATHANHPCSVWCRETSGNYMWLWQHFSCLCYEYTYRYGKKHATDIKLRTILQSLPNNIKRDTLTRFVLAMPDEFKDESPTQSYRSYYSSKRNNFNMAWSRRPQPEWF